MEKVNYTGTISKEIGLKRVRFDGHVTKINMDGMARKDNGEDEMEYVNKVGC